MNEKREEKKRPDVFTGEEPKKNEKLRQQRDPGAPRKERPWRPGEPDPLDAYRKQNEGSA
jgi:hypothetical protein